MMSCSQETGAVLISSRTKSGDMEVITVRRRGEGYPSYNGNNKLHANGDEELSSLLGAGTQRHYTSFEERRLGSDRMGGPVAEQGNLISSS